MSEVALIKFNLDLLAAANAKWPELSSCVPPPAVEWKPSLDMRYGDLSSDILLRLTEILRLTPEKISSSLDANLFKVSFGELSQEKGYLNLVLKQNTDTLPTAVQHQGVVILIPQPTKNFTSWSFMRLASRAIIQFHIARALGISATLLVGELEVTTSTSQEDTRSLFNRLYTLQSEATHVADELKKWDAERFLAVSHRYKGIPLVTWLTSAHLGASFQRDYRERLRKCAHSITVICPRESWCQGLFEGESFNLNEFSQSMDGLLYYLAGDEDGGALDLSVPRSHEVANLVWYLGSTLTRLGSLISQVSKPHEVTIADPTLPPVSLPLSRLLRIFPLFIERAATHGEVSEFLAALSEVLQRTNRLMNEPEFRYRHHQSKDNSASGWSSEYHILSGVQEALQSSIRVFGFSL